MGKHSGKNNNKTGDNSSISYDSDTVVFIAMSQELKEEGNKLFHKKDLEGAMLIYEKALKLLPKNHIDVCHLRTNIAACYMQIGLSDYPKAIHECNLALEVTPKFSKALVKRAKCYESLNQLELAFRDVHAVLNMEPKNTMALEISERVRSLLEMQGLPVELPREPVKPQRVSHVPKVVKEKSEKKNKKKTRKAKDVKVADCIEEEKKAEDKQVVEEKITIRMEEPKTVKLVFGEDIRRAQLPLNCSLVQLREVIRDRFPSSSTVLVKYRDEEGDLITITSDEELKLAEKSGDSQGSLRLYVVEVNSEQDRFKHEVVHNGDARKDSCCIDDWIIEFAQLFKNYVGFDLDAYLNLHELGMKQYSEAMEDTVTSEEAQDLFDMAAEKFREMTALALFNWGNVHMSRARKRVYLTEDGSRESLLEQIKTTYDYAQLEYSKAGTRYEEALRIKPDFYEAHLALAQQQFEQAKLSWYYAIGNDVDLENWHSENVLHLYNNAEENMEKGMQMWEELERQRMPADEAINTSTQINILWGTILYERSIMEFKLGLPVWHECLEVAIEKFEHAGASPTDVAVMVKNHCSNNIALEGFKIDEIIQAWNEMYEAKKWQSRIPSCRLEPLLRQRVSKIYHALEHA